MRVFVFLICFGFSNASVQAENGSTSQMEPEAFAKRSYTPTYAQLILARSTGRPYGTIPFKAPQVTDPPHIVPDMLKPQERPILEIVPKAVLSKPSFSFSAPASNLGSNIMARLKPYDIYIRHYSRIHDLDPNLVRAVIYVESGGDPDAVSTDGAIGLMQLMAGTADDMGVKSPQEPAQNIFGGTRYLSRLVERFGSLELALWAYNAGPERVKRKQLPLETRRYIPNVMRLKQRLDKEGI